MPPSAVSEAYESMRMRNAVRKTISRDVIPSLIFLDTSFDSEILVAFFVIINSIVLFVIFGVFGGFYQVKSLRVISCCCFTLKVFALFLKSLQQVSLISTK